MSHIVSREPWATVDINVAENRVFVREDWRYIWVTARDQPHWTQDEQHNFHHLVDQSIWSLWSSRALIRVRPMSPLRPSPSGRLREQMMERPLTVTFDVRRVLTGQHWLVLVTRVDPETKPKPQAQVDFVSKSIKLFSTDLLITRAKRFEGDQPLEGFTRTNSATR